MDGRFNTLAQQLFQKPLEHCSTEELRSFADQYPYFAPAHFLLLHKLPTGSEEYNAQYQKAILYYHSPAQFSSFLNQPSSERDFIDTAPEPIIEQNEPLAVPAEPEPEITPVADEPEPYVEPAAEEIQQPDAESGIPEAPAPLPPAEEPVNKEPATVSASNEPTHGLTFEPFHTVDYFASQGIKLSQEELPKDQLGKQMKSFTEWLKTMKRLPASELVKAVDSSAEKKVENLAQHSLQSADVVTEAMAEVWSRQGQAQKALDIYNKLSLQNPSKRAYFAAKIENLKKSL
jgi:hypothetical protein